MAKVTTGTGDTGFTDKGNNVPPILKLPTPEQEKQIAAQAQSRKLQVGSGDRSGRIRTYNFRDGRVTDHRINLTLHQLDKVMEGDLDELLWALQQEHQAELLAEE